MESALLLLGSNMGKKYEVLQEALKQIGVECGAIVSHSKIYRSEPWGFEADGFFLNMAIEIETYLEPHLLLKTVLEIENRLGRTRLDDGNYHSRTIDIDIIFYGHCVVDSPTLIIPHPNMHLRRFVLLPLSEIAPKYTHPILGISVLDILNLCVDKSEVAEYC